jgi:pyruvate,water dikinase
MLAVRKNLISFKTPLKKIIEKEVGGKAWNLFRLLHYGFPVPTYCVVSSRVFDKVIGAQKRVITDIVNSIDFTSQNAIEWAALRIRDFIFSTEFPKQFAQELLETVVKMFGRKALLSVRSSVVGEDSAEHSFAGQMDSFLNVTATEVAATIKKVWASAFSSRALVYRKEKRIEQNNLTTAVILQEMVQSRSSGVMFTRNPEKRECECVISAGFGLGEGVVTNSVETDTYQIKWQADDISKEVQKKDFRIVLKSTGGSGNQKEPLTDEMQSKQVLTDTQIYKLRDIGVKTEKRFKIPQDIEWAFDAKGRLFILQSRPIVFSANKAHLDSIRIWDNSNIIESYPGLTLPLTLTFVRAGYEINFRHASEEMVFFKKTLKKRQDIFNNLIGMLDGRIYYNLLNWYEILSYLPGFKKNKESLDQMIGISQKISFPQSKLSPFNIFCSSLLVLRKLISVGKIAKKFFKYFNRTINEFKDIDISKSSEHELIAIYEAMGKEFRDKWHLTIYNDLCAMKYYDWLKKLCNKWGLEKTPNLYNNLLCGERGIESVLPVRSLVHIAETLHTNPIYQKLTSEEDNDIIWENIQRDPAYIEIKNSLESHLQAYGDRGLEELKLENLTFREEPALLIELIKNYYYLGLSVESMSEKQLTVRRNAEAIIHNYLKNPLKRLVFWIILRNARRAIANRENMRFARTRLFGIMKRLFRRMANLFAEKNLLESKHDIYYLTVGEIFSYIQGTSVTKNLKALVKLRKLEYSEFVHHSIKDRLETTGIPYLNSLSNDKTEKSLKKRLKGINCSSGTAEGTAKVVFDPHLTNMTGDYILVAKSTDPGWVFLMIASKGIVAERGSVLSHTAIIGRELGIPTIVGAKDVTRLIPNGARMYINGSTGEIRWQ